MIDFQAPAGWHVLSTDLGTFHVVNGILTLADGTATALASILADLGFTNAGESPVVNLKVVTGTFNAAGRSAPLVAVTDLHVSVWAADPAAPVQSTFHIEGSADGGATWLPVTAIGTKLGWTGPANEPVEAIERGSLYCLVCDDFAGGAAKYRLSHS
jgi:hypothetical protein